MTQPIYSPPPLILRKPVLAPVPPSATHSTVDVVIAAATDFLLDHLGNQLIAGQPLLLVAALHTLWIVPIELAYIHTGSVGSVGVIAVDDETGRVIAWTPLEQIKAASRNLRERLEPQLSQQFQQIISNPAPELRVGR